MDKRHGHEHITQWREEGFAIIEDFFRPDEIEPIFSDFERL